MNTRQFTITYDSIATFLRKSYYQIYLFIYQITSKSIQSNLKLTFIIEMQIRCRHLPCYLRNQVQREIFSNTNVCRKFEIFAKTSKYTIKHADMFLATKSIPHTKDPVVRKPVVNQILSNSGKDAHKKMSHISLKAIKALQQK